ncbi:MAG: pyridoxal phosphate-dependent aminotransferase [Candidatus Omnitrophica bacterium]|nr:pyridoxal phosphate-dependent aminotransferase [Candidatus Omnitrophota bacterium]
MFSKRTEWELGENPLALELNKLQEQGVSLFDLTQSNPTQAGIAYPPELILKAFLDPQNLIYAPHPKGMLKTREAVAHYYADKGIKVSPENIVLTSSSSEAYGFLFRLLMDPHDRLLLPAPSYPLFSYLAGLNDVDVAYYHIYFDDKGWRIDFDSLEDSAERGAKAIVLVSPNNPTGSCIKAEEIKRLNALCTRYGMAIISDEVFIDYIFDEAATKYQSLALNTGALSFALGGLSKAMALPQMKLGWIIVNGPKKEVKGALDRLEVIADTYLSVNTPVQHAAATWLAGRGIVRDQIMARVRANEALLGDVARKAGVRCFPVEGGWYGLIQLSMGMPEDEWALKLLKEKHVVVHPGFLFDFDEEGFLVLSLLTKEDVFAEGLRRIAAFIEK